MALFPQVKARWAQCAQEQVVQRRESGPWASPCSRTGAAVASGVLAPGVGCTVAAVRPASGLPELSSVESGLELVCV